MNKNIYVVTDSIIVGNKEMRVKLMRGDLVAVNFIEDVDFRFSITFNGSEYHTPIYKGEFEKYFIPIDLDNLQKLLLKEE